MNKFLERTENLIGKDNILKLQNSKILLFGVGGVGGYVLESLIRSGVQNIDIVDNDIIDETNLNRQILATTNNIGKSKTSVAIERALAINPSVNIKAYEIFFLPENSNLINFENYDFVIDAIDTVTAKIEIIKQCDKYSIPLISSMGTGNKLDATKFKIDDIYNTNYCKLAKIIRKLCKENNIKKLNVLYSDEVTQKTHTNTPASISYVPAVAGLIISQHVINKIISGE